MFLIACRFAMLVGSNGVTPISSGTPPMNKPKGLSCILYPAPPRVPERGLLIHLGAIMKLKLLFIILLSLPIQAGQEFKIPKRVSKPLKLELTIHSTENYNTVYEQGEISCLALTVYGEIGNLAKQDKDITAIAHVILNRVGHEMFRKPSGVCEVVLQRGQFEPLSRMKGLRYAIISSASGIKVIPKNFNRENWKRVYKLSKLVYNGHLEDITNGAIGFYAPKAQSRLQRNPPSWAKRLEFVASIGEHNFYR